MMRAQDDEGVVLLLVLGVIVVTIGSVYAFGRTSVLEIRTAHVRMDRVRAEMLARSGIDIAIRALQDDGSGTEAALANLETSLDPWRLLGEQPIPVPGEGELRITVRDAGNRLNLNALVDAAGESHEESRAFLRAALEHVVDKMPGRSEDKPYQVEDLADAVLDWLDSDDLTRLGDGEGQLYARLGAGSSPANRPIIAIEELEDVPGVDAPLLEALRAYFTTQPLIPTSSESGVNPNTAPPHVLALIFRGPAGDKRLLDRDDVFRILRARDEGRIFCPQSTEDPCVSFESEIGRVGQTVFPPLGYRSDIFAIESAASFGIARACIATVIDRETLPERTTLSYRMDC